MHTFSQCGVSDSVPRSVPRSVQRSAQNRHKQQVKQSMRESGFHEPLEFTGAGATPSVEETHLLTYKSSELNHINSNHVNHRLLRAPGEAAQKKRLSLSSGSGSGPQWLPESTEDESRRYSIPPAALQSQTMALVHGGGGADFESRKSSRRKSLFNRLSFSKKNKPSGLRLQPQHQGAHDCKLCGCERIRINVSGQYFETRVAVLNLHPDTLLGNPRKRQKFYDRTRDEFFIDRHRPSFEAIFAYFQYGGKLKRPHTVADDIFLAECHFYEIEKEVLDEYKTAEGYVHEDIILPTNETMKKIWMLFEYPETSLWAFIVAVISVIMTLVSIVLFCVETLQTFETTHCESDEAPNFLDPFFVIETVCTAWFTIEVIVRFVACPSKVGFLKDFKNIVDLTAIIPYYVTFFNVVSTMSCSTAKSSASLAFLRVIRLIRIFKLTKHSTGLQVLILTFKASVEGLGLFLVALVVCLLVFSSAIYYAELGIKGSQINSIPDAFWWAIITMTTVGYGDKVPVGAWGKLIGSTCALVGVLTLAIPVPIITGNFNRFYSHKTGRGRLIY